MSQHGLWNLNVASPANAWDFMTAAAAENTPIVTMQEIRMNDHELRGFRLHFQHFGYRSFVARGGTYQGRWNDERQGGGVCMFVSVRHKCRQAGAISMLGGQAVFTWIEGRLLGTCYVNHQEDHRMEFLSAVGELVLSNASATWLLIGDWNLVPSDNPLVDLLAQEGGQALTVGNSPTRWAGNRCIDYAISNWNSQGTRIEFMDNSFSDHIAIKISLDFRSSNLPMLRLQGCTMFAVPPGASRELWRQNVEAEWKKMRSLPAPSLTCQEDVDAYWAVVSIRLEAAFRQGTLHTILQSVVDPQEQKDILDYTSRLRRSKNAPPRMVQKDPRLRKPDPEDCSYKVRVICNLRARIAEYKRRQRNGEHGAELDNLIAKIARAPQMRSYDSLEGALFGLQQELDKARELDKRNRINRWKARMRSSPGAAYRWLKQKRQPDVISVFSAHMPIIPESASDVASSHSEALEVLSAHWRSLWQRQTVPLAEILDVVLPVVGQPMIPQQWQPVTAMELCKAAASSAGSSAGLDGWCGNEVAGITTAMWEDIAPFFAALEIIGCIPSAWRNIRQTHLPKQGKEPRVSDGAMDASAYRPISVSSVFWRIWGKARIRQPQTAAWISSWFPEDAFGGKPGHDAQVAIISLLEAGAEKAFLGTFDYSLAFDSTEPQIPLMLFQHYGMPPGIARLLSSMWTKQRRYLQLAGATRPSAEDVATSLPQGDPWSMFGMVITLKVPAMHIARQFPCARQVTFVDDRSWAAPTARMCLDIGQLWSKWSSQLGLQENHNKAQYYHCQSQGRAKLLEAGALEQNIKANSKILGVEFAPRKGRTRTPEEALRVQEAARLARRCSLLPLPRQDRIRYAAAVATPKAAWGWAARAPSLTDFREVDGALALVCRNLKIGDTNLQHIMNGHRVSASFISGASQVLAGWRRSCLLGGPPAKWTHFGWAKVVRKFMSQCCWLEDGEWQWRHDALQLRIALAPGGNGFTTEKGLLSHNLREAWRSTQFLKWLGKGRIDSRICGGSVYSTARCKAARLAAQQDRHQFAVLVGAAVSPAKLLQMTTHEAGDLTCQWCHNGPPTWEHVTWTCAANGRPPGLCPPDDPLQRRLGWPCGRDARYDSEVLSWMASIRSRLLEARWAPEGPHLDEDSVAGDGSRPVST